MRVYWEVARRGFRRYATYRGATFGGLFTNTVFGFMRGYVLLTVLDQGRRIGGYDATDAITYIWLTQGMIMVIAIWGQTEVVDRIRTGAITTDLSRPIDFQGYWLAQDLGRAGYAVLSRGVPPMIIGGIVFDLRLPDSVVQWAAFALSLLLAVLVSFAGRFVLHLSAFWLLDANGPTMVYSFCANFFSGFIIPVALFPGWLRGTATALPFASMLQTPIDVFIGQAQGGELVFRLLVQGAWAVALLAAGRALTTAATRRLVVQGG